MNSAQNMLDGGETDAVDAELLDLPAPPSGRRLMTLALMALVVVASLALVASVRHDLSYFFASPSILELGDVNELDPARLRPNTQVRISGTPGTARAVRYRRPLSGASYVVFPLAGQAAVYVQVEDTPEALAQSDFSGRLVTFSQMGGRLGEVEEYFHQTMSTPISGESYLLIAGAGPASYAWALGLALLCLLVILLDLFFILRWFRPIMNRETSPEDAAAEP